MSASITSTSTAPAARYQAASPSASASPARSAAACRASSTSSTSPASACTSDNDRLLITRKRLRDLGNTVIVVEHDEDAITPADYIVDVGPGAGVPGRGIIGKG